VNENDSSISEPDVTAENPVSEHWVWTGTTVRRRLASWSST